MSAPGLSRSQLTTVGLGEEANMLIKPVSLIQDVEAALALRVKQARLWAQLLNFLGYKLAEWIINGICGRRAPSQVPRPQKTRHWLVLCRGPRQ